MKNDLFKSVGDNKDTWSVHVKVPRKWVIRKKAPLYPVQKIDMILVDEEVVQKNFLTLVTFLYPFIFLLINVFIT